MPWSIDFWDILRARGGAFGVTLAFPMGVLGGKIENRIQLYIYVYIYISSNPNCVRVRLCFLMAFEEHLRGQFDALLLCPDDMHTG